MEALAEKLRNANVRLEKLFWVPGICAAQPDDFEEFVQDDLADSDVINSLPFLKGFMETIPEFSGEDITSELSFRKKNGFIFQAATPRPSNIRKDGSYSFSWGNYYTKWMYAESLEEVAEISEKWARDIIATAKAKAAA